MGHFQVLSFSGERRPETLEGLVHSCVISKDIRTRSFGQPSPVISETMEMRVISRVYAVGLFGWPVLYRVGPLADFYTMGLDHIISAVFVIKYQPSFLESYHRYYPSRAIAR